MNTITTLIQAAERMIRDTKTPMGELCATWNRLNFEAGTGLSFSTPTRRSKMIERLEAAIIELNSRDDRMGWDGKDNREFSGNSIAADHEEAIAINSVHPETPRYFVADNIYKVTKSGFVYRWDKEWVESHLTIVNIINMGATEVTEADIKAYTTIPLATVSTDKGRWFVLVDANNNRQHLYEFHNEQDAVEYAQRVNSK